MDLEGLLEDMTINEKPEIDLSNKAGPVPKDNEEWGDVTPAAAKAQFKKQEEDDDWGDLAQKQQQPAKLAFGGGDASQSPEKDGEGEGWGDYKTPMGKNMNNPTNKIKMRK